MNATFDKVAYDGMLDDVETYLGYLKGNELVYQYLQDTREKAEATGKALITQKTFTTPCPDPAFTCKPLIVLPALGEGGTVPDGLLNKIHAGANTAWHQGPTWAAGVAGQARSITEQLSSPDVVELETALTTMTEDVLLPLKMLLDNNANLPEPYQIPLPDGENSIDGDWAKLDGILNTWHGSAADEFRRLYRDLNVRVGIYAYFAGTAALELAAATAVIKAAQSGLFQSVKDVRTTLVAQLAEWTKTSKPPRDDEVTWFDIALELIPITKAYKIGRFLVKTIKDPDEIMGMLVDIQNTIIKTAGKQVAKDNEQPFEAADSEAVLGSVTKLLRDSYLHNFMEALSDLSAAPSGSVDFLHTLQEQGMWAAPRVSGGSLRGSGDSYPA